jgi:hypothetical protein
MTDMRWGQYLFARHSRSELAQWAATLKYFIDPPQDNRDCLALKYYPELWAARACERG